MSNTNAHKPGYKHTPLGWIPEEWDIKRIGQAAKIYVGKDLKEDIFSDSITGEFVYPVYSNTVDNEGLYGYYSQPEYTGESLTVIGRGVGLGTAFARSRSYGAIGRLLVLFPNKDYSSFFVAEYINGKLRLHTESSGIPQLTGESLANYSIVCPPLTEQKQIATILSTWNEAIQKTQQLIEHLKQRNKGLMQQLLTGKKRLKGFGGKWKQIQVRNIADEVGMKNRGGKDLTVLSCTKYHGLVDSLEYFGRRVFSEDTSTYKVVPKAHFAYATNHIEEGSIGYQDRYDEALISPMYTVFKTQKGINDTFLYKVLKSQHYIHEYQKRMEGSIDRRGGLRWDDFSKIPIQLPDFEEQTAIATVLDMADSELKLQEQQLTTLQEQKKGLMQKLLSGEVRVKM